MAKNKKPNRPYRPDKPRRIARPEVSREEEGQGGGFLTSMRSGIKDVAGTGPKKKKQTTGQQALNLLLWLVIIAIASVFIFSRVGR